MAYQKNIDAAFAEVKEFDFYEAFNQNELIYISQAMEAYATQSTASLQQELEEARKWLEQNDRMREWFAERTGLPKGEILNTHMKEMDKYLSKINRLSELLEKEVKKSNRALSLNYQQEAWERYKTENNL